MGGERFYCLAEHQSKQTQPETEGGKGLESTDVEDLSVSLEDMFVETSGFANSCHSEVAAKQKGELFPPKTLHLLVCGKNLHLENVQWETAFNKLEKSDRR